MQQKKVKSFKDSVHGYIYVPEPYVRHLIDNVYFQRLRNIDQTDIRIVYPSAKHDRFSHSLGVFYLGQKAVEALRKNHSFGKAFEEDYEQNYGEKFETEYRRDEVLFLAACLLHDIGHTPFSHSLEEQILENSLVGDGPVENKRKIKESLIETINRAEAYFYDKEKIEQSKISTISAAPHEMLGSYLIFKEFERDIRGLERDYKIFRNRSVLRDDMSFIVRMIMGIKYEVALEKYKVRNCFIELLNGNNFDVDKLDYIVRDTHMSGIDNVSVDVERLLGALCIVTKTKYFNKQLSKSDIKENLTITKLVSHEQEPFSIEGNFKGIIRVDKGAEVKIEAGSRIECLCASEHKPALISYCTNNQAVFTSSTELRQENTWIKEGSQTGYKVKVKQLPGLPNKIPFRVYIKNGELLAVMNFKAEEDLEIHVRGFCKLKITGNFSSIDSLRLAELQEVEGKVSEIEVLGDLFKNDTPDEESSELTYSIGFKKQAVNIIANVLEARNYLYLWVCAHHKVVYYANFLIPVIVKEISRHCGAKKNEFPLWGLCYDNLKELDDFYIWTAIRHINSRSDEFELSGSYKKLVDQLFSRVYSKSLYKSLVEFELFFDLFTEDQRAQALNKLRENTDRSKPYLTDKDTLVAGYLDAATIREINKNISELTRREDIRLKEVLYVVIEFKQKQLDTNEVYMDMGDEKLPISQIRLLSSDKLEKGRDKPQYFYLYYDCEENETQDEEQDGEQDEGQEEAQKAAKAIKKAVKDYLMSQNS